MGLRTKPQAEHSPWPRKVRLQGLIGDAVWTVSEFMSEASLLLFQIQVQLLEDHGVEAVNGVLQWIWPHK